MSSRANIRKRFNAHERYMVRCERNGARPTLRTAYAGAHERWLDRLVNHNHYRTYGGWWL